MCESPTISRAKAVQSKKAQVCEECLRWIEAGQMHEYVWGIWEGEPMGFRVCAECYEVREDLRSEMEANSSAYPEEIACDLAYGRLRKALADECREIDYAYNRH